MSRLFITPPPNQVQSGIYYIKDNTNGKVYVGSAVNLKRRKSQHFSLLRKNQHPNPQLQACFNKKHDIKFFIAERCLEESLLLREQEYLDRMWDNGVTCFNVSPEAERNINGIKTFDVVLVDPNGNEHGPIVGLSAFARKHGLYKENLSALIKGRLKSYKGWRLKQNENYIFDRQKHMERMRNEIGKRKHTFITPNGEKFSGVENLYEFERQFGFEPGFLSKFISRNLVRSGNMTYKQSRKSLLKSWTIIIE